VLTTTVFWVSTAFVGPQTDDATLIEFYRKVRPAGPGWHRVRALAGIPEKGASPDNIPMALLGWFVGCTAIWSALFTVGNVLYGRPAAALFLGLVFLVSTTVLVGIVRKLWRTE
jgi:hypothetical protein